MANGSSKGKSQTPEIVSVTAGQLEALLLELRTHLPLKLYERVEALLRTLQWVMEKIEKAQTTIGRLHRLIFGALTEKLGEIFSKPPVSDPPVKKKRAKGRSHGRNGAGQYAGARPVAVSHPTLRAGDPCPHCLGKGKLGPQEPTRLVRITAQPILTATVFSLQKFRCHLCGQLFTAPVPPEAGPAKYAPNVGLMLGFLRFGAGLPHYRMEKIQRDFGVPMPQSTQWELMAEAARDLEPVGEELLTVAASGELLHNDDTPMRVQSLKKEKAAAHSERTGIFTTNLISQVGPHQIALFLTGGRHAGENLDLVLKARAAELAKPLHMCDALPCNLSKEFEVLLCHCLPHGRRKFVEVAESFPAECRKVLESLAQVFKQDAEAREQKLEGEQRLRFHQEHSQPVMTGLREWMREQMDQKKVEPNSGLGEAIAYMLKHWEPLTLFLRHPGAPLSNNICERALKMAITHRKNSLGYKTANGARIGDLFMSLIHTCRLNEANPFEYLTTLQRQAEAVKARPGQWLPWNFRQTLASRPVG